MYTMAVLFEAWNVTTILQKQIKKLGFTQFLYPWFTTEFKKHRRKKKKIQTKFNCANAEMQINFFV